MSFSRWLAGTCVAAVIGSLGAAPARADNLAYMGTGDANFGVIDLTTGAYTSCGNTAGVVLAGLAAGTDKKLYGASFRSTSFYSITPTNGALTTVGQSNISFFDLGSTTTGIYAVDVNGDLYAIDSKTGGATLVGPTGVGVTGSGYWGMSTNSTSLYFSHQATLYRLNLKNGHGVVVGTGSAGQYGALVGEHSVLFAGSESPFVVYTVNTVDGSNSQVSSVTGTGATSFWGLAPIKASTIKTKKICALHAL